MQVPITVRLPFAPTRNPLDVADAAAEYADKKGNQILGLLDGIKDLFKFTGDGKKPPGFTKTYRVQIEDGRQSYDRLLQAFAGGQGDSVAERDLAENKKQNDKLDTLINQMGKLIGIESAKKAVVTN